MRSKRNDTEENTSNVETDESETLNQEEEASINNNDTVEASINNEDDNTNMDISDDGSNMEEDIHCIHSSSSSESKKNTVNSHLLSNSIEAATTIPSIDIEKTTPLSKTQRNNRNSKIKKDVTRLENQRTDGFLRSVAFQNVVEQELPFPPMQHDRQPKPIIEKPKVYGPDNWVLPERLLHAPWKSSKSSNEDTSEPPKQKKVKLPAIDYVVVPNCGENNFPSYPIDDYDDDEGDDDDDDEDDDYDDYYDGVAEYRTISPTNSMLPHEVAGTHASKAPIIAGKRQPSASMRRKKKQRQMVYRTNKKSVQIAINRVLQESLENQKKEKNRKKKRDYLIKKKRDCIKPYVSCLQCEWNHECRWGCGYVHLNRATKHMKSNCCYNGLLSPIGDSPLFLKYGNLKPMSPEMQELLIDNIEHMGPLSSTYGNVLSLAQIGVENGSRATGVINTHVGGFECRGNGAPDCVTMYGRTFHYLTMARDLASGIGKYY